MSIIKKVKSFFNQIKSHPRLGLIVLLLILLFIIVLLLYQPSSNKSVVLPSSSPASSQSPFSFPLEKPPQSTLQLTNINPPPPSFESFWATDLISFSFNLPLQESSIKYQIAPSIQSKIIYHPDAPNTFSILPLTGWGKDQNYQITIQKSLTSQSNIALTQDITIKITRTEPSEINIPNASF